MSRIKRTPSRDSELLDRLQEFIYGADSPRWLILANESGESEVKVVSDDEEISELPGSGCIRKDIAEIIRLSGFFD